MAQPSSLQSLGGPLGDKRLEFGSGEVLVGSGPDCQILIEAPGVAARHARLMISASGTTIHRLDGPVGINDDLVATEGTLRSGDFVWIGEPGGDASIMLQFTLGDVEEAAPPPPPEVRTILPPADLPADLPEDELVAEDLASVPEVAEEVVDELASVSEVAEEVVEELAAVPEVAEMVVEETVEEVVVEESLDAPVVLAPPAEPLDAAPLEIEESDPIVQEADLLQSDEPEPEPDPVDLDPQPETLEVEAGSPEILETDPVDLDALGAAEAAFDEPLEDLPAPAPAPVSPSVPPAPWQVPAAASVQAESPAEYASAWESAPAAPAAPAPPESEPASAPEPPAPAPPAPAPPAPAAPAPRPSPPPAPKIKARSAEQDAALRTPPPRPQARTTSSTPAIVGGLAAVLVLGGAALFFLREPAAPVTPAATPLPVPVATATLAPTVPSEPEGSEVGTETPPPAPTQAQAGPAAGVASTPPPRATPPPRTGATTPPPVPTRTAPAAGGQPVPAPTAAAPVAAAPASQVPGLLEQARAAAQADDLSRSSQLLDQVLSLQPGNPEATSRKAEVAARIAALAKKFSVSGTTVIGGKAAKGPTGFDLGGGGAVQSEYSGQIRCTSTPASVEPGKPYRISCSILNVGTKAFRLQNVTVNESTDGARSTGAGVAPRQDVAPQSTAVVLERSGTWAAKSQWSLDITAKTNKDESFRAIYSWR